MEISAQSTLGPQQQHGRHGAPTLQQNSQLRQKMPAFPEHPRQVQSFKIPQLQQKRAKHKITLSSSTASSQQPMTLESTKGDEELVSVLKQRMKVDLR